MHSILKPKILCVFEETYSLHDLLRDIFAGIIVGILSMPMSIAFAIASGANPEQGLYTAIIAGFLASLFGGSRVQISGPTGAFVILIFSIIQNFGYEGLAIATLIAGIILIVVGFAGFGKVIQFIPYPVTIGFTGGLAIVLFTSQIKDFLGLKMEYVPLGFINKIISYSTHISSFNPWTLLIGSLALLIIIFWKKISSKIPGSLVAIIITTCIVKFYEIPVETIGSRFGSIPTTTPLLTFPAIDWRNINQLIPSAIAIALLAGIESLLSASVADGMTGRRHRSNMELIAQGIANIGSVLFGGLPATGTIARTATNIKNGGHTPIAGIVNSLTIFALMFFLSEWVSLIPLSTIAALVIIISYNISEWNHFFRLFLSPKEDIAVLLTTFILTVFADIITALEVGIILAAFLFINKTVSLSKSKYIKKSIEKEEDHEDEMSVVNINIHEDIEVFEIYGSFFFAAVEGFKTALNRINRSPKVLIIRMRNVLMIDASGMRAIIDLYEKLKKQNTVLIISGIQAQPLALFKRAKLLESIGEENFFPDIYQALRKAEDLQ